MQSLDLTGPWEVLHTASMQARDRYELVTGATRAQVRTSSGVPVSVDRELTRIRAVDTLIVVGGVGTRDAVADRALLDGIRRLAGSARRVCSVCSGAFLLAEAGLLEGKRAVTHWSLCELLSERYPEVNVEADPIYVRDGKVFTSAGVTAGIDLALALVEEDHGPAAALEVARYLVVYARRPGGQAQFSVQLAHQATSVPELRELQGWIAENLDTDLSVSALATRLNVSERHFARLFRRELGTTPADYVEQARVERAREALERGATSLDRVAADCGFRSAEVMRRAFHRRLGVGPRSYRDHFRLTPA
jgi:transcriptional regulator GlxA family with amidase domain